MSLLADFLQFFVSRQGFGAYESGLIYAFVALGVLISFKVLDFPDLTVDGSFPLGAAVAAVLIMGGVNPWTATLCALLAGACAGLVTAALNQIIGIPNLLASILTMTALYSVNVRILGGANISLITDDSILTPFLNLFGDAMPVYIVRPLILLVMVLLVVLLLWFFLISKSGLAMRATGANLRMAKAQGIWTSLQIFTGMALSNALVATGGALFAQVNHFADVSLGIGTIVLGLAAVIVGGTLLPWRRIFILLIGCVIGSIIYWLLVAYALRGQIAGLTASDLNLVTAGLIVLLLVIARFFGRGLK